MATMAANQSGKILCQEILKSEQTQWDAANRGIDYELVNIENFTKKIARSKVRLHHSQQNLDLRNKKLQDLKKKYNKQTVSQYQSDVDLRKIEIDSLEGQIIWLTQQNTEAKKRLQTADKKLEYLTSCIQDSLRELSNIAAAGAAADEPQTSSAAAKEPQTGTERLKWQNPIWLMRRDRQEARERKWSAIAQRAADEEERLYADSEDEEEEYQRKTPSTRGAEGPPPKRSRHWADTFFDPALNPSLRLRF